MLAQSPRQYGLEKNRWTIELLQKVVGWLGGVSPAGAWQILKRLGLSRKQALSFIRSPDPLFRQKVRAISQAFRYALWHPEKAAILFEDELSYRRQPAVAPAWGATGSKQPLVHRCATDNTLSRIGATLDGITGQLLYLQGGKFGVDKMNALYHLIRDHYHQPDLFVVQDNCRMLHDHPDVLQTAQELRVTPVFLPTYASWLNPIEKLWRWLRQDCLYNHTLAHDLSALRGSVSTFLDQFAHGSDELLHYCGLLPI